MSNNVTTSQTGAAIKTEKLKPVLVPSPRNTKLEFNTETYTYTSPRDGVDYVTIIAVRDLNKTSTSYIALFTCSADKYTDAKLNEMISHASLSE